MTLSALSAIGGSITSPGVDRSNPDGTAYVGALGGLVRIADAS